MASQRGVLLADGVGLGKTWEALAGAALILAKSSQKTKGGSKRKRMPSLGRILVMCPPGLVSKWRNELLSGEGFIGALNKWCGFGNNRKKAFVWETFKPKHVRVIRYTRDLATISRSRTLRGETKFVFPPGFYIASWTSITPSTIYDASKKIKMRLTSFVKQRWDVIIVDEAHHKEAKKSLLQFSGPLANQDARQRSRNILLTATPFQLEPAEIHDILAHLFLDYDGRLLDQYPLDEFIQRISKFFSSDNDEVGTPKVLKKKCEQVLKQVVARTVRGKSGRTYWMTGNGGKHFEAKDIYQASDSHLMKWSEHFIAGSRKFEREYLEMRFQLAGGLDMRRRLYVAETLRQAISSPRQAARAIGKGTMSQFPRLEALADLIEKQVMQGFGLTMKDGRPRKILVFTHFVGSALAGAARDIAKRVNKAYDVAIRKLSRENAWYQLESEPKRMQGILDRTRNWLQKQTLEIALDTRRRNRLLQFLDDIEDSLNREPYLKILCGLRPYCNFLNHELRERFGTLLRAIEPEYEEQEDSKIQMMARRRHWNHLWRELEGLRGNKPIQTFTGNDDRKEREASAAAFQSPLPPWILVASNVGSEGIDLQKYCKHLIHYDLEWNPAKMAQREGRGDRIGRRLPEKLQVYFLIVKGTYDERILHQVIARDRWHSVLLGKPLGKDDGKEHARLASVKPWILNLAPRG
jgi:hypothetical protein